MAKTQQNIRHFNFTGGLNTEGGELVSAENAWVEGNNVYPDADGSITTRESIDYEDGYTAQAWTTVPSQLTPFLAARQSFPSYTWTNVNQDSRISLFVAQVGSKVYAWRNGGTVGSNGPYVLFDFASFIGDYLVTADVKNHKASFSQIKGALVTTHPLCHPILTQMTANTPTFYSQKIVLKTRDYEIRYLSGPTTIRGDWSNLSARYDPGVYPATAAERSAFVYDLGNAGWTNSKLNWFINTDPNADGMGPNRRMTWWVNKVTAYPAAAVPTYNEQKLNADTIHFPDFLKTMRHPWPQAPAPRGHYILEHFSKKFQAACSDSIEGTGEGNEGVVSTANDYHSDFMPSVSANFAGRMWFAGCADPDFEELLFTQVVYSDDYAEIDKCYMQNDPTAEDFNDVLANDGGSIKLHDAGQIYKMESFGNALIIFADNGIWSVGGTTNGIFSANDYEVKRLSNVGVVGPESVVRAPSGYFIWSHDGIYALGSEGVEGLKVQQISLQSIQTFYDNLHTKSKKWAKGIYHPTENTIYWAYRESGNEGTETDDLYRYQCNKLLCLDLGLGAFYTYEIGDVSNPELPTIAGMFLTNPFYDAQSTDNVVDAAVTLVEDAAAAQVKAATGLVELGGIPKLKFFLNHRESSSDHRTTFGEFKRVEYDEQLNNYVWDGGTNRADNFDTWAGIANASIVPNVLVGPDGIENTADAFQASTGTADHYINTVLDVDLPKNTDITYSVWAKKGDTDWIVLRFVDWNGVEKCKTWFNLSTGTVGTITSSDSKYDAFTYIQAYDGGWWRIGITCNSGTGATTPKAWIYSSNADGVTTYAGSAGAPISMWLWGAKVEVGTEPSRFHAYYQDPIYINRDYYSFDGTGVPYIPYIISGFDFGDGGGDRALQVPYIHTYMRRTVSAIDSQGDYVNHSSCLLRGRWEWSDTTASNRWGSQQQVYRPRRMFIGAPFNREFNDGVPVVRCKLKIRGRGRVLQLEFRGEEDHDMSILGWSYIFLGDNTP